MKVMIIDDSRLARKELRHMLKDFNDIQVLGEASNAGEGMQLLKKTKPDLLFLDIQMPEKDGFEFLEALDEVPEVVFVTAYDEFAIKAFEYNALDYLQKPVSTQRLERALDKVRKKLKENQEEPDEMLGENSRVFVKDGDRCWFVTLRDIRLFEVMDNYTRIYFEEEKPLIPKSLSYLESRLDPKVFFRANRQQIINTRWIERIEPWFSDTIRIHLRDGTIIEVSRRQTSRFKELMSF